MSAEYPTGDLALTALVEARTLLAGIKQLQARANGMVLRLGQAANEAEWRARNALTALDEFATSDPLQLGRHPTDHCYDQLERGFDRTRSLELQVAELLRDVEDGS